MAAGQGQITSYNQTVPQKRVVTDRIFMKDPMSIAGLLAVGMNEGGKFQFVNAPGKVYEWLEDVYTQRSNTAVETLSSDSTVTQFVVTTASIFSIGDVLLVDSEYMWVSAVTLSTNTLTVTRQFGGTQATHANTSVVNIVGKARLEGTTASDSYFTAVASVSNYSVILQKSIEISRSDQRLKNYGIANVKEREIDKAMDELLMQLNLALYHGQSKVGTATTPRSAAGLAALITTNATALSSTPALTQKNIEDEIAQCWAAGGAPDLLLVDAWGKRKIADFYSGYVRTERTEKMGGIEISSIMVPLGLTLDVVVDRHIPAGNMYFLQRNLVGLFPIDEFFYEDLAKTKDTAGYGQVVGEYGFVVAAEKFHSRLSGYSVAA